MNSSYRIFGRNVDGSSFKLFSVIFIASILAKGIVVSRGYSIDDYPFSGGIGDSGEDLFFSQGRYLMWFIFQVVESLGVSSGDLYFPLGIAVLTLQSAFVVSVFRFAGVDKMPAAGLVGALVVAHPYLTEVLTFRLILPSYCAALFFSIVALEAVIRRPSSWSGRGVSLIATLCMVFTYQVFLNYFAIAIAFALLLDLISRGENRECGSLVGVRRGGERALDLTGVSAVAAAIFLAVTALARQFEINGDVDRAKVIGIADIPERIRQIYSSLTSMYWGFEPIYSGWLKTLIAVILLYSIFVIVRQIVSVGGGTKSRWRSLFSLLILILLVPASLGLIVAFRSWWPVPRVVAHVSVLVGLLLLSADFCLQRSQGKSLRLIETGARFVVLVGFIFLSNQILVDQQRLNDWDKLMANRIVSRLEMNSNFGDVRAVSINGGSWAFPRKLRTIQGDLNVSSFFPPSSKVALLSEVSGYRFMNPDSAGTAKGADYCKSRQPWPHVESVTVIGDLAIICLKSIS